MTAVGFGQGTFAGTHRKMRRLRTLAKFDSTVPRADTVAETAFLS